jgi:hypothetical protein
MMLGLAVQMLLFSICPWQYSGQLKIVEALQDQQTPA